MDIKVPNVTTSLMRIALDQAKQARLFLLDATPANSTGILTLEAALQEQVKQLQETPVTGEELARVKAQVVAGDVYQKDSIFYQAMQIGEWTMAGLDYHALDKRYDKIRQVTAAQVRERLEKYGPNALEEAKFNPVLKFLSYFWGPIPWMIEIAAILSAAVQHWVDLIIIAVLLIFNGVVGFWQEYQAANAVDALKKQLALKARVKRDGEWQELEAAVPRGSAAGSRYPEPLMKQLDG